MIKDFNITIFQIIIFSIGFAIDIEKYTIDDKTDDKKIDLFLCKSRRYFEIIFFSDYSIILRIIR